MTGTKTAFPGEIHKRPEVDDSDALQERMRVMAEALLGGDVDSPNGAGWSTTGGSAKKVKTLESAFDYESVLHPSNNFEDPGSDHTVKPSKPGKPPKP